MEKNSQLLCRFALYAKAIQRQSFSLFIKAFPNFKLLV